MAPEVAKEVLACLAGIQATFDRIEAQLDASAATRPPEIDVAAVLAEQLAEAHRASNRRPDYSTCFNVQVQTIRSEMAA